MFLKGWHQDIDKSGIRNFFLCLSAVTIPFNNNLNSWCLVLFCVTSFIQVSWLQIPARLQTDRLWMVSATYFFWLWLTSFWDVSGGFVFRDVERYAGFLVFPFLFSVIPPIPKKILWRACLSFLFTIVIICLYCLAKALLEYQSQEDERIFFYHYLSQQAGLNAVILSNYCLESIIWLLFFRFTNKVRHSSFPDWLMVSLIAFLAFMIFLLSSKLNIFLLLIVLIGFAIYGGYRHARKRNLAWLAICIILVSAGALVYKLPYLKWRLSVTSVKEYSGKEDNQNGLGARLLMWHSAWELIRERPLLGYGIVGSRQELMKKYQEKEFEIGIREKYNTHNQFIETALMSGFIGLGIYILFLGKILRNALRQKNWLLGIILTHFVLKSMVETMLDVQQDIVFFLFFIFLFYYFPPNNPPLVEPAGDMVV